MNLNWRIQRTTCVSARALAVASLFVSASAWAQDAAVPAQTSADVQPAASDTSAQAEAQAQAGDQFDPAAAEDVGVIVVTAQKREERLQDVPITVNVVGAKQLEQQNITNIGELTRAVPALSGAFIGGGTPQIRGVATIGFGRSSESAVSTVIDGVVGGKAGVVDLVDVERVEVLSGPQGMLFGKNASSGVINIITVAPKLNKFELIGSIDYGRFEYERERLTLNAPIADTAALRVTGYHDRDESVVTNVLTGKKAEAETWGGRARVRWEPTDNLEINLIGDYAKSTNSGEIGLVYSRIPDPTGVNALLVAELAACGVDNPGPKNRENCPNAVNKHNGDVERYGLSGQIDWTLPGDYLLTSITASRWQDSQQFGNFSPCCDVDSVNSPYFDMGWTPARNKVFSQEVRLTSPANKPVEFVAGLYFSNTNTYDEVFQAGTLGFVPNQLVPLPSPPFPPGFSLPLCVVLGIPCQGPNEYVARAQKIDVNQKSYAAFGQATYHAGEKLSFILGGRYTHETLDVDAPVFSPAEVAAILAAQGIGYYPASPLLFNFTPVNESLDEDNFSWRVGVQYEPNPNWMFFATASRGYKGPAVADQGGDPDDPIIESEIPMSYELGAKATLANGKIFTTLTLFHTKVKDFQTVVFSPDFIPAGFVAGNAPFMTTKGIDFSIFGSPLNGLTVSAGAIYNIAKYSSDYRVGCFAGPTATHSCEVVNGAAITKPNPQIPDAPKFKFVANAQYTHHVSQGLDAFIQSDVQYQTKTFTSSTPDSIQTLPDQFYLNGRIGVRDAKGRWGASLWGRNILGNTYVREIPDFLAGLAPGRVGAYVSGPNSGQFATYGLSLDFAF